MDKKIAQLNQEICDEWKINIIPTYVRIYQK